MNSNSIDPCSKRILSIQSHVVSGYVGNKAAVFPLQLLGFDVDVVNSVHFSNHTGYPNGVEGDVLKGHQLRDLLNGLERNGLLPNVGHILTGYIGSESFLEAVLDVVQRIREVANRSNPDSGNHVRYVCDPVLGDHGKFYVPPELVEVYKRRVVPIADVLTPNQFEVEQLTGIQIQTLQDAQRACEVLHSMGPVLVMITSLTIPCNDKNKDNISSENHGTISIVASQSMGSKNSGKDKSSSSNVGADVWAITCPEIQGRYTGTGDLCAALLLAHTALRPNDIPGALEYVVDTMYAVIEKTYNHSKATGGGADDNWGAKELKLIQSKKEIENPPKKFKAIRIQ